MTAPNHLDRSAGEPPSPPARSLAYLVSMYPALSMTFVLREVLGLLKMGFRINVASINPPDRTEDRLTDDEREEYWQTYYVKTHGLNGAVRAHLRTLLNSFRGYSRGVGLVFRLGGWDLNRLLFNFLYFTEALMVGRWMRHQRQTHLHCHLAQQAATVGLFVKRVFEFGYSITVHGPDEFYDAKGQYLAEKIAAADFIICISSFARSQLMLLSPYAHWVKLVVSRLGIDPEVFVSRAGREQPEVFEILCVGRLTPAKGQHLLIDAVGRLAREGRRLRLRLVGDGPEDAWLRAHAARSGSAECVIFEGAVNQDGIRTFYATADAFALPSFAEGIPVVLMEAMAMGIPCVTTRITGIPELIRDGIDGLLIAPGDLDELVAALARLMDDAALRERLAMSGRARVVELYDLRKNVERLAGIFGERVKV